MDEFSGERVVFLEAKFPKPTRVEDGRRDKVKKRIIIASEVRRRGGGYLMYLDADDLVHRRLAELVLTHDNKVGYVISSGYALDFLNNVVAPIPGAWKRDFNQVCGSSGIVYFETSDLPGYAETERQEDVLYFRIRNHGDFERIKIRNGRRLKSIQFPAAIYTLNHTLNLSDVLVRSEQRQKELIDGIHKWKISDTRDLTRISVDFGLGALLTRRLD